MYYYTGKSNVRLIIFDYTPKEQEWAIKSWLVKSMGALVQTVCSADVLILNKAKKPPSAKKLKETKYLNSIKSVISKYEVVVFSGVALAKQILTENFLSGMELQVQTEESPLGIAELLQDSRYKLKVTSMRKPKRCLRLKFTSMGLNLGQERDRRFYDSILSKIPGEIIKEKRTERDKPIFSKASDGIYTVTEKDGIRYGFTEQPSFFYKKFFTEMKSIMLRDIDFVHKAIPIDDLNIEKIEIRGGVDVLRDQLILENEYGKLLPIGFDIESTGIKPWEMYDLENRSSEDIMNRQIRNFLDDSHLEHSIISASVATELNKGFSFLVQHPRIKNPEGHKGLEIFRWVCSLPNPKVIHNGKFEFKWICGYYGIEINGTIVDTMVNEHLLNEGMFSGTKRYSMEGQTAMRLQLIPHKEEYLSGILTGVKPESLPRAMGIDDKTIHRLKLHSQSDIISARTKDFTLIPNDKLHEYGVLDAVLPLRLLHSQMDEIKERGMFKAWKWIGRDLIDRETRGLGTMEYKGFPLDSEKCIEIIRHCDRHIKEASDELREIFGDINFNSAKELDPLISENYPELYEKIPRTSSGELSIKEELTKEYGTDYPWLYPLFAFRHAHKVRGTYMVPFMQYACAGKTHFNFHIAGPATGRLSSYQPNMQNIPETVMGIPVKTCLVPEPGKILVNVDLSNAEMRMLANMSRDEALIKLFEEGLDRHSLTASGMYNVPYDDIVAAAEKKGGKTDQEKLYTQYRQNAKPLNFGITYGISGQGVARQLGCSVEEGEEMIAKFFQGYPGVKRFLDDLEEFGSKHGYIETITGRRRYFPLLQEKYKKLVDNYVREKMMRQLKNFSIQSPTSDIFQYVIADIIKIPGVSPHITVHDSIVFSFDYKNYSILNLHRDLYEVIVKQTDELWPDFFEVKMNFDIEIGPDYGNHIKLKYDDIVELDRSKEDLFDYYYRVSTDKH